MDKSIFTDKNSTPSNDDLKESLGDTYQLWQLIKDYVISKYSKGIEEWNCSNYGWSFRIKDKKRAIIYLLPRDEFFKVAFVFGQKATDIIMQSQISQAIKAELSAAKVYAEGRGIRIDIKNDNIIADIRKLIDVKMAN
ncbi:MAG: DUF3788 family protein [Bacteroidales bacterium]|nr:DUF3788 family protein [Bacteroidales bacterium]